MWTLQRESSLFACKTKWKLNTNLANVLHSALQEAQMESLSCDLKILSKDFHGIDPTLKYSIYISRCFYLMWKNWENESKLFLE